MELCTIYCKQLTLILSMPAIVICLSVEDVYCLMLNFHIRGECQKKSDNILILVIELFNIWV